MNAEACKFRSTNYCCYSATPKGGTGADRVRVATIDPDAEEVLDTLRTSETVRQEIMRSLRTDTACSCRLIWHIVDGVCFACRETVAASGATDIREER